MSNIKKQLQQIGVLSLVMGMNFSLCFGQMKKIATATNEDRTSNEQPSQDDIAHKEVGVVDNSDGDSVKNLELTSDDQELKSPELEPLKTLSPQLESQPDLKLIKASVPQRKLTPIGNTVAPKKTTPSPLRIPQRLGQPVRNAPKSTIKAAPLSSQPSPRRIKLPATPEKKVTEKVSPEKAAVDKATADLDTAQKAVSDARAKLAALQPAYELEQAKIQEELRVATANKNAADMQVAGKKLAAAQTKVWDDEDKAATDTRIAEESVITAQKNLKAAQEEQANAEQKTPEKPVLASSDQQKPLMATSDHQGGVMIGEKTTEEKEADEKDFETTPTLAETAAAKKAEAQKLLDAYLATEKGQKVTPDYATKLKQDPEMAVKMLGLDQPPAKKKSLSTKQKAGIAGAGVAGVAAIGGILGGVLGTQSPSDQSGSGSSSSSGNLGGVSGPAPAPVFATPGQ